MKKELQKLIIQAQDGDLDAFGAIVTQFQDMAVGYAYSILGDFHLAEDAVQEAFIGVFRDLRALREPKAFSVWLRRLIFKQCDRLIRGKHIENLQLETIIDSVMDEKEPETMMLEQEMKERILSAVNALPENERVAITLFYLNEYSQKEIAQFLEVPASTINGRLQTARKRLSVMLSPELNEERITTMIRENLTENIPSKDDKFVNNVQLFNAAETGQLEKAKALLIATPELINVTNSFGQTPLHRASYRGHKAIVRLLIEKGADVNAKDKNGQTPLHQLAIISVMPDIAELLINAGADINSNDNNGDTPLFLSLTHDFHTLRGSGYNPRGFWELFDRSGAEMDVFTATLYSSERLENLLQKDPTLVNARRRPDNWTPLHYAADLDRYTAVEVLLKHGANVSAQDAKGRTPLQLATHRLATEIEYFFGGGWSWIVETLLDHSAGEDIFDNSALGRWERIIKLCKGGRTPLYARNAGGNTPLHVAAWNGQRDVIQFFMLTVGDLNLKNDEGKTPIQMTVEGGHRSVAEMLLRRGVECDIFTAATLGIVREVTSKLQKEPSLANATDHEGRTVLQCVSARWRKEKCFWREWRYEPKEEALLKVMELLIESGAKVDIWTAASLGRQDEVMAILKTEPALVDTFEDDFSPIHCAALMGHTDIIDLLLDNGASVHARGIWSCTPLHLAGWSGQRKSAEMLLDRGADIEARTGQGMTPLYLATYEGQLPVVELLVEHGADVNAQPNEISSPLLEAIWHNYTEVVKFLIRHGADVNFRDMWGQSPLRNVVPYDNRYEITECLLENGAEIDDRDKAEQTPLHVAARSGCEKTMRLLISKGADVNARDKDGKTSLSLALEKGHENIATILRQNGAIN